LLGGGYTPTYGLYQKVASGWVNGFIICDMGEEVYQLFYYEYTGLIPDFGETCEFVMLQVSNVGVDELKMNMLILHRLLLGLTNEPEPHHAFTIQDAQESTVHSFNT
jgi:hypothetical protein